MFFSRTHLICGVQCSIWPVASKSEQVIAKEKLECALVLIKKYTPVKFSDLVKDVSGVLVAGIPTFHGQYIKDLKLIELYDEFVIDPNTTAEELASTLIHEAQHGRLFRLGYGYDEGIRGRIEALCFRSERLFGSRIPNGIKIVENADVWLSGNYDERFTNKGNREAHLNALDNIDIPRWFKGLLLWLVQRKST